MAVEADIYGHIRGVPEVEADLRQGTSGLPAVNPEGDLALAQALPRSAEASRLGQVYRACQTTAVDSVQALPTTAAQVTLWNGEPLNGKTYVIHSVTAIVQASSFGAGLTINLAGCLTSAITVTSPGGTLLTIRGLSGTVYKGRGEVSLARTVAASNVWFPLGNGLDGDSLDIAAFDMTASTVHWDSKGSFVVPPGLTFNVAVVTAAGAGLLTVRSAIRWQEVQL